MSEDYEQLLEATIQHLQDLKAQGVRFVPVTPGTIASLTQGRSAAAKAESPRTRGVGAGSASKLSSVSQARPSFPSPPIAPASNVTLGGTAAQPVPVRPATALMPDQEVLQSPKAEPSIIATSTPHPGGRTAALEALRQRVLPCTKCPHLAAVRKNVVFGAGNPEAELMFVGEAPGADEDIQGEPFVGKAGQLLTKIIQATGLSRGSVYIANILKCRPDTPGQTSGNRQPTPEEMNTCIAYLQEQIDIIQPKVLVALGAVAMQGLLGKTGITRLRGHWHVYRGIPLMPTYHPAFLLRNQSMAEKRRVWEDMLQVMEKLGLPISEKQRGYFLKAG